MNGKPNEGDTVSVSYFSSFAKDTKRLSGEVVESRPTPDGWTALVDSYSSGRYKIKGDSETMVVSKADKNGKFNRVGFAEVDA